MPFAVLVIAAFLGGIVAYLVAMLYPTREAPTPTETAGRKLEVEVIRRPWLAHLLSQRRLDPERATGLALTVALAIAIAGGLAVGVLAYLMRSNAGLVRLDSSVGQWGADHGSSWSTRVLTLVTDGAGTPFVVLVVAVVAIAETIRVPNRWVPPFLLTVVVGEVVIVNTVKQLLHRVRPTFNPIAATLGPSFPSGHSATAAALYAAVALVVARRRSRRIRALLVAAAVAIAVAVACSRVMLGVHWLSDVIAGLAFGWAWFAVCAIAFGGRFLRFAAPVQRVARVAAEVEERPARDPSRCYTSKR